MQDGMGRREVSVMMVYNLTEPGLIYCQNMVEEAAVVVIMVLMVGLGGAASATALVCASSSHGCESPEGEKRWGL